MQDSTCNTFFRADTSFFFMCHPLIHTKGHLLYKVVKQSIDVARTGRNRSISLEELVENATNWETHLSDGADLQQARVSQLLKHHRGDEHVSPLFAVGLHAPAIHGKTQEGLY